MAFENEYTDSFLARLVTDEKEQAASDFVDNIAAFTNKWRGKLVVCRVYISICLDAQKGGQDDVYSTKLSSYRKEWSELLGLAKADTVAGVSVAPAFPSLTADPSR